MKFSFRKLMNNSFVIIPCRNLLLSIFLMVGLSATAQRPKIGLTLSGGGAKGMAHVGLLQALDSAGLKVDYITGTSMGSIVGAMYATGYSGNQIDSISRILDWGVLLSGKPKFTDVGLEEKDEFGRYSFEIPMDGFVPKMGTGLIESEEIWLQFSEIFFHVYDQKDFSKFDIPFKCIAADLSTGEKIVLDSGELVKAIRSSMSMPSIFAAVEYDSTHYVDGGIVSNFPVSDVKEMGADFIIGVNLFSGLEKSNDLNSAMDVMYQIINYRDAYDLVEQKKLCDILIEPPMGDYGSGSFSDADKILDIGAAMKEMYYPYFKKIADSLNAITPILFEPNKRFVEKNTVIIDDVENIGLKAIDEDVLLQKSNLEKGVPYTAKEITDAFRRIYSTLYFKYIYYELIPTKSGHANMVVHVKENSKGAFKLGFSYHSFTTPAIILNYTARNLVFTKSRSLIKVAISEDFKGLIEHKQFFGKSLSNSFSFYFQQIHQKINTYNGYEVTYQYGTFNTDIGVRYNYYVSRKSALGLSVAYMNSNFTPNIASGFRFDGYSRGYAGIASYEINSIDRPFLPTKGIDMSLRGETLMNRKYKAEYVGIDTVPIEDSTLNIVPKDPFFKVDFYLNWYISVSKKMAFRYGVQFGKVFSDTNYYLDNILVGGSEKIYGSQFPFYGYREAQLPATSLATLLFGAQYKIYSELYAVGRANIGVYNFFTANQFIDDKTATLISGFNLGLAYNLSMLPMELSFNYSPEIGKIYGHIRVGFIF